MKAWQHDPEIVFACIGATVGAISIFLFLAGVFPLAPVNFWFFSVILVLLGLYRPNWCFLFLVAVLPFEIIIVSPDTFLLSLRPYQWIFLTLSIALSVRVCFGRNRFPLFASSHLDYFLALIPIGALISGFIGGGQGIRLGIIVVSFYAFYLLGRVFLKTIGDIRIAIVTLFASGLVTAVYGIAQNIAFEQGISSLHAVMPGRPNGFFAEPDWLGFFMALLLAFALARLASTLEQSADNLRHKWARFLFSAALLLPVLVVLILTVSRSAWLAAVAGAFTWAVTMMLIRGKESFHLVLQSVQTLIIMFVVALLIVIDIPLTRFDLFQRAESTATGFQEITIACDALTNLPAVIQSIDELAAFDCRHINLEDRTALQSAGFSIQTVRRPDPNVAIRSEIYGRTWKEIKAHSVFGIGWGNIGPILGTDAQGSSYNASNVWLEIGLGAGLIGLFGLFFALGFIVYQGARLVRFRDQSLAVVGAFPLVASFLVMFFVFNFFNAGLLIGLVWLAFAMLPPLLPSRPIEANVL